MLSSIGDIILETWLSGYNVNCFTLYRRLGAEVATARSRFRRTTILAIAKYIGDVAEWLKAPHSKRGRVLKLSGVQILPSPQELKNPRRFDLGNHKTKIYRLFFCLHKFLPYEIIKEYKERVWVTIYSLTPPFYICAKVM